MVDSVLRNAEDTDLCTLCHGRHARSSRIQTSKTCFQSRSRLMLMDVLASPGSLFPTLRLMDFMTIHQRRLVAALKVENWVVSTITMAAIAKDVRRSRRTIEDNAEIYAIEDGMENCFSGHPFIS
ncbi:hypothetical protein CHS0354_022978, partial [Potamilus streckersoni]